MADPASITFGVIGVVAVAVRSTVQLKIFIDSIEGAPAAINAFSTDLGSLSSVLQNLQTTIKDPSFGSPETRTLICQQLDPPLENCVKVLEQTSKKLQPFVKPGAAKSRWRPFRWSFREKEFSDARILLLAHKSALEIALSTANL